MNEHVPPCFYRVSAKGLILDEEKRFLLCRESDGRWDLPGGGLDHGEDPRQGIIREIKEEMGLEVTSVGAAPSYFITAQKDHKRYWIANIIYVIEVADLDFTPSDECQEIRFFAVEEAKDIPQFENIPEFLKVFDPSNY